MLIEGIMEIVKNLTKTRKMDLLTGIAIVAIFLGLLLTYIYINAEDTNTPTAQVVPSLWNDCEGYVALTYDDGPSIQTPTLLKSLKNSQTRATFFVLGLEVKNNPETVKAAVGDGHVIANHSMNHPDLTGLTPGNRQSQLVDTSEAITRVTGQAPNLFRPPMGITNAEIRKYAQDLGMLEVIWTVDTFDWKGKTVDEMKSSVTNLKDGDIVLMHDAGKYTLDFLPALLEVLKGKKLCPGKIVRSDAPVKAFGELVFYAKAVSW